MVEVTNSTVLISNLFGLANVVGWLIRLPCRVCKCDVFNVAG